MGNDDLALLSSAKTILLTTYKRDGTPVATPVSIAFTVAGWRPGPGRRRPSRSRRVRS